MERTFKCFILVNCLLWNALKNMLKYEGYKVYQPRLKLLFFVVNSIFLLGQCSSFHLIYTITRWHITLFVFAMFLHISGWDLYVGSTIVGGPLLS